MEEKPPEEVRAEEPKSREADGPRLAGLRTAHEERGISKEVYEENLRRLRGSRGTWRRTAVYAVPF